MGDIAEKRVDSRTDRTARAAFAGIACALVVLAATIWFSRASGAAAQTSMAQAVDQVSASSTHYRGWVVDAEQAMIEQEASDLASSELLTVDGQPVEAGKLLEVVAFVHEFDGSPVSRVDVLFEWSDGRGKVVLRDTTDYRGFAVVRRWVPSGEAGHKTTVKVDVSTATWSNQRWVWFVPR